MVSDVDLRHYTAAMGQCEAAGAGAGNLVRLEFFSGGRDDGAADDGDDDDDEGARYCAPGEWTVSPTKVRLGDVLEVDTDSHRVVSSC